VLDIVVAEDSLLVREGIRGVLETQDDLRVVATCGDYDGLLAAAAEHRPHVVVTDVRMPPTYADEGIRAAVALRAEHEGIGVVVLSQYAEPAYATPLFEDGTDGRAYLLKERVSEPDQLCAAVRTVAAGGSVIDPKVVEVLVGRRAKQGSPLDQLTPREREVLEHVAQGKNNAAVAAALFLTERAVEKRINTVFAKLQLTDEPDVNRRVKAVLLYLADNRTDGSSY
jgi:DNA-binding NarL/FixJ family response regulator